MSNSELTIFTLTALITIFLSSYLLTYNEQLYRWCAPLLNLRGKDSYLQTEDAPTTYDVWVVGYHRIGWKICQMLKKQHRWFAVIDHNPETIAVLRRHGIPAYFGDIGDVEFLDVLPFASAKLVILTVPDPEPQLTVIRYLKSKKSKALIIGNLHHSQHVPDLYHAGATFVMMPHLLGGDWITNILTEKPWTKHTFAGLKKNQAENLKQRYSAGIH